MLAAVLEAFGREPELREVPDPVATAGAAVVRVTATGVCRSDWHAVSGHDPDVVLPHVPGHEFAGVVESVGPGVTGWRGGERVTAPFVHACGTCPVCRAGEHQVCPHQEQPGFSRWGSFAELVVVERADVNLVALPDALDDVAVAALGCRFATAFRAVVQLGRVRAGEWVAVHGCGGVGLSAVTIAQACGARVVAVDVSAEALALAGRMGATAVVDASVAVEPAAAVRDLTGGGAHMSLDAFGSQDTCAASISSLRVRGRHVQVGLLPAVLGNPAVPMHRVVSGELEILGCHGMAAHAYPEMLALVVAGRVRPQDLVTQRIPLSDAGRAVLAFGQGSPAGVTVVVPPGPGPSAPGQAPQPP